MPQVCYEVGDESYQDPPSFAKRDDGYRTARRELLQQIRALGKLETGVNREPAVSYFRVSADLEDSNNDLKTVIQQARHM